MLIHRNSVRSLFTTPYSGGLLLAQYEVPMCGRGLATSLLTTPWQFYFQEKDVGKNRAEVSLAMLRDLNQYVNCSVTNTELSNDVLMKFQVRLSWPSVAVLLCGS